MFQIDIAPLEPGVHREERTPAADALNFDTEIPDDVRGFDDLQVELVIDYQPPRRVLVMFEARATAALTCDRTLQPFEQAIKGSYSVLFAAAPEDVPDANDEHDEVRDLPPGAHTLDLTDLVRDTLLLAVPQRKVAPGAQEEDLDTVFGAPDREDDEPVDPRWEKLRQLKSDDDS